MLAKVEQQTAPLKLPYEMTNKQITKQQTF